MQTKEGSTSGRVHLACALAGAVLLAQSGQTLAQNTALERQLESASRIDCRFTALATGDWGADAAKATVTETDLEAAFFDIDVDGGTAEAEGVFGAMYIVVRYAHGYLHFMQMSDAGPLHLTTVLAQETSNGRLKAVQTRHEYTPIVLPGFTARPEMYVGDCEITSEQ